MIEFHQNYFHTTFQNFYHSHQPRSPKILPYPYDISDLIFLNPLLLYSLLRNHQFCSFFLSNYRKRLIITRARLPGDLR